MAGVTGGDLVSGAVLLALVVRVSRLVRENVALRRDEVPRFESLSQAFFLGVLAALGAGLLTFWRRAHGSRPIPGALLVGAVVFTLLFGIDRYVRRAN
jgi:hypothetical protein